MSAIAISAPVVSEDVPGPRCSATCEPSRAAHPNGSVALNSRDQSLRSSNPAKQIAWTTHTASIAHQIPASLNGYQLPLNRVPAS